MEVQGGKNARIKQEEAKDRQEKRFRIETCKGNEMKKS